METQFDDLTKQRKLEILRILREGDINTRRADGDWNFEAFVFHFDREPTVTEDALWQLIKENAIYVDGLGLYREVRYSV